MTSFSHRSSRLLAAAACAIALAASHPDAWAQGAAPRGAASADQLFEEGNKAYDGSDYALAAKKYREAFAIKPTFDIAANLGAAELKLAQFAEAANHLAFAIRNFPPSGDPKKKAGAEKLYGEARRKVGAFEITAPAGAEVSVDDVKRGVAPLADPVFVDPGEHQIEAKSGGQTGEKSARVLASESTKVDVAFGATSASGAGAGPVTQPPGGESGGADDGGPPYWPGIALAATGGVAIGVGLGLFVAGSGADSDGDALAKEIKDSGTVCTEPPSGPLVAKCADGEDKQSEAQGLQLGGGIAMGVGGAMAVGGIVYLIWAATTGDESEVSAVQPWLAPGLLGGAFRTSF